MKRSMLLPVVYHTKEATVEEYFEVLLKPCCCFVLFVFIRHVFLSIVRVPVKSTVILRCLQIAEKGVSYGFVVHGADRSNNTFTRYTP